MKRFIALIALCCALPLYGQWYRQPTPNDTLQSVRVLPDGKVLFQLYAPQAQSVMVLGDLPWDKPVKFEKTADGVWKGLCEGLGDGLFRYSFVVDGVRVQDPKAPLSAEQASVLTKGLGYLREAGVKYEYLENAQAGHSWTTWRADLQTLAPTLFR